MLSPRLPAAIPESVPKLRIILKDKELALREKRIGQKNRIKVKEFWIWDFDSSTLWLLNFSNNVGVNRAFDGKFYITQVHVNLLRKTPVWRHFLPFAICLYICQRTYFFYACSVHELSITYFSPSLYALRNSGYFLSIFFLLMFYYFSSLILVKVQVSDPYLITAQLWELWCTIKFLGCMEIFSSLAFIKIGLGCSYSSFYFDQPLFVR